MRKTLAAICLASGFFLAGASHALAAITYDGLPIALPGPGYPNGGNFPASWLTSQGLSFHVTTGNYLWPDQEFFILVDEVSHAIVDTIPSPNTTVKVIHVVPTTAMCQFTAGTTDHYFDGRPAGSVLAFQRSDLGNLSVYRMSNSTGTFQACYIPHSTLADPALLSTCPNPAAEAAFLATCAHGTGYYDCLEPANSTCLDGPATCDTLAADCVEQCGGASNIESFNCTSTNGSTPTVDQPCTCKEKSCSDSLAECYAQCGGAAYVKNFSCDAATGVTVPCECSSTTQPPNYTDGTPDTSPIPSPDPVTPTPSDPNNTTYDPNVEKVIDAQNATNSILSAGLRQIESVIHSLGAKLDGLVGIIQSVGRSIKDAISGIDTTNTQPPPPDTTYSPTSPNGPYTLPAVDFGGRLTEFVATVKASSLFGLPNSAFSVPGSTTSQLTIDGGETFGVHVFDLADMSALWSILKAIVLTGFSYAAVRIVCLKGGSQ